MALDWQRNGTREVRSTSGKYTIVREWTVVDGRVEHGDNWNVYVQRSGTRLRTLLATNCATLADAKRVANHDLLFGPLQLTRGSTAT